MKGKTLSMIISNSVVKDKILKILYKLFNIIKCDSYDEYPSLEIYNYMNNNKFFLYDNKVFTISKIDYKKYNLSKLKLNTSNNNVFKYFDSCPAIIHDIEKLLDCLNKDNIRKRHSAFFIMNSSSTINYKNTDNLSKIQNFLLEGNKLTSHHLFAPLQSSINFWLLRGWSLDESLKKVSEFQSQNSQKFHNLKFTNPERYNSLQNTRIEYWLAKGYTEIEAAKKLKERQCTFSLNKCIKKYGNEKGREVFAKRQIKWQKTLTSKEDYIDIVIRRTNRKSYSNISQELFNEIYKQIKHINVKVYYQSLNHEWGIGIPGKNGNPGRGCLYDFVIPDLKYAIEFNGLRWHPRKETMSIKEWKEWKSVHTGQSADDIYKLDCEKNEALINKGFDLDIIWDDDYYKNKYNIIKNISDKILKLYEERIEQSDN